MGESSSLGSTTTDGSTCDVSMDGSTFDISTDDGSTCDISMDLGVDSEYYKVDFNRDDDSIGSFVSQNSNHSSQNNANECQGEWMEDLQDAFVDTTAHIGSYMKVFDITEDLAAEIPDMGNETETTKTKKKTKYYAGGERSKEKAKEQSCQTTRTGGAEKMRNS